MKPARMRRSWARLAPVAALAGAVGIGSVALLVEDREPPAPRVRATVAVPPGPIPCAPAHDVAAPSTGTSPRPRFDVPVVEAPPRPTGQADVARQGVQAPDLVAWVEDRTLEPTLRYAALRRLESVSPFDAVSVSLRCLDDTASLVRLNAIAVLTRTEDARAREALGRIDPRSQRLARALVARR